MLNTRLINSELEFTSLSDEKNGKYQPLIDHNPIIPLATTNSVHRKNKKKSSCYDFFPIPKQNSLCGETYNYGKKIYQLDNSSIVMQYGITAYDTVMQPSYCIDRVCYRLFRCCNEETSNISSSSGTCSCPLDALFALPMCGIMLTWYSSKIPFHAAAFSACCLARSVGYGIQYYQSVFHHNQEGPSPQSMNNVSSQPSKWQKREMFKKWLDEDNLHDIYNFIFDSQAKIRHNHLNLLPTMECFFGLRIICLSIRYNDENNQVGLLERKNLIDAIEKTMSINGKITKTEMCSPLYEALITEYKDGYKLIEYLCEKNCSVTFALLPFKYNDNWFRCSFFIWMYFNYITKAWSEQEYYDKSVLLKYYDRTIKGKFTALFVANQNEWERCKLDIHPGLLEMSKTIEEQAQEAICERKKNKILSQHIPVPGLIKMIGQYTGAFFVPKYQEEKKNLSRQNIFSLSEKEKLLGWRELPEDYIKITVAIDKIEEEKRHEEKMRDSHLLLNNL